MEGINSKTTETISMKSSKELIENSIDEMKQSLETIDNRVEEIESLLAVIQDRSENDESTKKTKISANYKFELLSQMHQQYSVKESNNNSFIVSFLAVVFAIFTGYGLVYVDKIPFIYLPHITILSFSILCILNIICLYFGYLVKTDQIIVYEIRAIYGIKGIYRNPYKKWNYIPALYLIMILAILLYTVGLFVLSIIKDSENMWLYSISLSVVFIIQLIVYFYFLRLFRKNKGRLKATFEQIL